MIVPETEPSTTSETACAPHRSRRSGVAPAAAIIPGILLTSAIAGAAFALRQIPGVSLFSPMILAIVIGIAFHNFIGTPARAKAGVTFSLRRILRFAIILLGLQLTAEQVAEVGIAGVSVIMVVLTGTFVFTTWLGRMLGIERKLVELIAAGTSICGASAVIATNTVTNAPDEDVAYAVACVTVFGSIAMFCYPLLEGLLHLPPHAYGLWAGSSIHEIAQVVAAAYQDGKQAGDFATIAKLSRVMMLAPVVISLGLMNRIPPHEGGRHPSRPVPMPWFVLGFIALVGVNSVVAIPTEPKAAIVAATSFLLSVALAAMGLETDIRKLRAKGLRPLFLGLGAFLFIAGFSLMLVKLTT
ncbi:MAG: YeiH family putative sulfate export transporter [Alphaproteobacteria bacterium]|nr:YeiH family protein [Alphaproteobacteria bacterium]MDE2111947.1 YeiH family putative sulfate export transporter [Alphaproteobacteria bacterium]